MAKSTNLLNEVFLLVCDDCKVFATDGDNCPTCGNAFNVQKFVRFLNPVTVCKCGHKREQHDEDSGCLYRGGCNKAFCRCEQFEEK